MGADAQARNWLAMYSQAASSTGIHLSYPQLLKFLHLQTSRHPGAGEDRSWCRWAETSDTKMFT